MGKIRTMDSLKVGDSGRVQRIAGDGSIRCKLLDMGITTGVHVEVVKVAPLGDPVDILVRGYHLSLRRDEAAGIKIEVDSE